jgi:hypothetical protein
MIITQNVYLIMMWNYYLKHSYVCFKCSISLCLITVIMCINSHEQQILYSNYMFWYVMKKAFDS